MPDSTYAKSSAVTCPTGRCKPTPAAWNTDVSAAPDVSIQSNRPATAPRSAMSHATTSTAAPVPAIAAARPATPSAAGPDRLVNTTRAAPRSATQPAVIAPTPPVPPVTSTDPRGVHERPVTGQGARSSRRPTIPAGRIAT
ncbi:hypothetical protein GCM10027087_02660 [Paractinoplanes abujensis]